MWRSKIAIAVLLTAIPFTAIAKTECPARQPGAAYPWQTGEIMSGDRWAWVYIDVDKKGRPVRCRIGNNNIDKEMRFWVCKAFTDDWRTEPVIENGIPRQATVKRFFVAYGAEHRKIEREARKRFFHENPAERPECYPD